MTREEITEKLKSLKADIVSCGGCEGKKDYAQALTETIEVLQTEPCEDCISRQAVLDKAKYWIAMQETKTGFIEKRGYFVDADNIKALPSVQPKPKKGYISIADVMSVFDDFMCGDVDENETETFLEMLKDKAESEDKE